MSGSVSMVDGHIDEVLKPCPFCGGNARLIPFKSVFMYNGSGAYVSCALCEARTKLAVSKDKAIEEWNRRVNDGRPMRMLWGNHPRG